VEVPLAAPGLVTDEYDYADCALCGGTGTWVAEHNAFCCEVCCDVYEVTGHEIIQSQISSFYKTENEERKQKEQHPLYDNAECITCGGTGTWIAEHDVFCCGTCGDVYNASKVDIRESQVGVFFHNKMNSLKSNQTHSDHDNVDCITCGNTGTWIAEHQVFCCGSCEEVYEASEHEVLQSQISAFSSVNDVMKNRISSRQLKNSAAENADCITCGGIGVWIAEHGAFCCENCGDDYQATSDEILKSKICKSFHTKMQALSSPLSLKWKRSDYENATCTSCGEIGVWIAKQGVFCCELCGDVYDANEHEILQSQINDFYKSVGQPGNPHQQLDYDAAECNTCKSAGIWIADHGTFCCEQCGDVYEESWQKIRRDNIRKFVDKKMALLSLSSDKGSHQSSRVFVGHRSGTILPTNSPRCPYSFNEVICNSQAVPVKPSIVHHDYSPFNPRVLEHSFPRVYDVRNEDVGFVDCHTTREEDSMSDLTTSINYVNMSRSTSKQGKQSNKKIYLRCKKFDQVFLHWFSSVAAVSLPIRSVSEMVRAGKNLHHNILRNGLVITIPEDVIKCLNDSIKLRKRGRKDKGHIHWLRALQQVRNYLIQSQKVLVKKRCGRSSRSKFIKRRV
jgi:endogenous inhibitor of DNA gyrase (YacG/DUF329 family)